MTVHTGKDGHIHPELQDSVALQMIIDSLKEIKDEQVRSLQDNKQEHKEITAKVEKLRDDMNSRLIRHESDLVRLTTQAGMAGRVAGFFAGAAASIIIAIVSALAKHMVA